LSTAIEKSQIVYSLSAEHPPVARVDDRSTVVFQTCDCFENQIQSADTQFDVLDWNRINPATGPVYIEGAEPGDLLVVHIQRIDIAEQGVMMTGPKLGVLGDELQENTIKIIPIRDGKAWLADDLGIPLNKMIGVIGTAPAGEAISCGTPGFHGGNMDCKRITEGAFLILPVHVPGALLAMGDLHAAMADGEVAVCGIEIAGEVTVQVTVIKGKIWPAPMLINADAIMTIASAVDLDDASTMAVKHMVQFLGDECGMDQAEATLLLSVAGDLRICQVVDPLKTTRVELPRWIAEQRGFHFSDIL